MRITHALSIVAVVATLGPWAPGCSDEENFLEGSLDSIYDVTFDTVRARQFIQSRQLLVEYERSGGQKPIVVTFRNPQGPGSFDYDAGEVDFSCAGVTAQLPEVTSATAELELFSPEVIGSEVEGAIHAMFTSESGSAFSLEGAFKTTLEVVP